MPLRKRGRDVTEEAIGAGLSDRKCPRCKRRAAVKILYYGHDTYKTITRCVKHGKLQEHFFAFA